MRLRVVLLVVSLSFLFACGGNVKPEQLPPQPEHTQTVPASSKDSEQARYQQWMKEKAMQEMKEKLEDEESE